MTTGTARKKTHFLSVLHLLGVLALAIWWGIFFWNHSPSRRLAQRAASAQAGRGRPLLGGALEAVATRKLVAAEETVEAGLVDLVFGAVVLAAFAVGTGVHVRRLEIWLQARSSGQAVAFGATGLSEHALAANAEHGGHLK